MIAPPTNAGITEAAQLAAKLHQAVLSLSPPVAVGTRQVHRMARSLALAELRIACRRIAMQPTNAR